MELHHGLNIIDYSVLGIVLLSGLLALMRGFVREVLSLLAWIAAYFVAANYYTIVEPWALGYVKNKTGATALAAVIVFVAVLTIMTVTGYFAAKLIRGRTLTAIDRSLGFFFGLLRGVLICCLVYLGASYIPWLNMDKIDNAQSEPQIQIDAASQDKPADTDKEKDKDKDKDRDKPPEWLVEAKTRPALAYGANVLKVFIPDKAIERTMKEYDEQSAAAHRAAGDKAQEKVQEMLGMPAKPAEKPENSPSYDDKSRQNLDHLIDQKSNQ